MVNIAIVIGSFHKDRAEIMLEEARETAKKAGLTIVKEVWVPGSLEKPLAVKKLFEDKNISAVAVLGIIEKGETKHGLVMGQAVLSALIQLQLLYNKPVGVGILGPDITPKQIDVRLRPYAKNAILAIPSMLELF